MEDLSRYSIAYKKNLQTAHVLPAHRTLLCFLFANRGENRGSVNRLLVCKWRPLEVRTRTAG